MREFLFAIGKGDEAGAGQSRLSRVENEVLETEGGLKDLEAALDITEMCSGDERGTKSG